MNTTPDGSASVDVTALEPPEVQAGRLEADRFFAMTPEERQWAIYQNIQCLPSLCDRVNYHSRVLFHFIIPYILAESAVLGIGYLLLR